jgi:hypothetical protein
MTPATHNIVTASLCQVETWFEKRDLNPKFVIPRTVGNLVVSSIFWIPRSSRGMTAVVDSGF